MINLYKELIIDHSKNPRNKKKLDIYTHNSRSVNHICGDDYSLYINFIDNFIFDISFEGSGCSISMASASIMTSEIKGKDYIFSFNLFILFFDILKGKNKKTDFESLNIFSNLIEFPSRIKCASLIWHILKDALKFNSINKL